MESWRKVWRDGIVPHLTTPGLLALRKAVLADDPRLMQGGTVTPPPLHCVQDWPAEASDAIGFAFWQGDRQGTATVGEVEEFFARLCFDCDQVLEEPAGCRWFLNWYDETPRAEVRLAILPEIQRELLKRNGISEAGQKCVAGMDYECPLAVLADKLSDAGLDDDAGLLRGHLLAAKAW